MKTQRLDELNRRLEEEQARRRLQRKIYFENKLEAHKKLCCRASAKQVAVRVRKGVMGILKDVGFMEHDPMEDLEMFLMPWLVQETVTALKSHGQLEETAHQMLAVPAE